MTMKACALKLTALLILAPLARGQDVDLVKRHEALNLLRGTPLLRGGARVASLARQSEVGRMLDAISSGSGMGPGAGWFGPGQARRSWDWLAARHDGNEDGRVTPREFNGAIEFFLHLDRDGSGAIDASDFDWTEASAYLRRQEYIEGVFAEYDLDANGKLSPQEWSELFRVLGGEKAGGLVPSDLTGLLTGRPPTRAVAPTEPAKAGEEKIARPGPPSRALLLSGLLSGEVGSYREGPSLGDEAPGFTLLKHDESGVITLSEMVGRKKPIVLIFGSFT